MKVLWLCNIMLPMVAEYLGLEASNKEGWLSGLMAEVLERQAENNIQLAVAFPGPQKGKFEITVDSKMMESVKEPVVLKCYSFVSKTGNRPECYDPSLEDELKEIIGDFKPDMVHCFGTEYPHTLAMCKVFPRKDRILIGLQGLCFAIAEAYYADLPKSVTKSVTFRDLVRKDTLRLQQKKFALRGEMEKEALRLAGNVTGRTPWDKKQSLQCNPNLKYYHMNETLRANFYGEGSVWNIQNCEPYSIFISQGDYPLKGLHYILKALPYIEEKFPGVKLYVAGADLTKVDTFKQKLKLSAYGKYLRKLIQENELQEKVCFLGRLSAEQMKERYLKSNLFVCCSSLENSPNSLGEAMLLGVPCVSADVGGVSGIFTGGEDGILYEGFRPDGDGLSKVAMGLADAVIAMWENPQKMAAYTQNAKAHALETHNGEKNYRRMVEIYQEIVSEDVVAGGECVVESGADFLFVSNYINHHQIPFCNKMYEILGEKFAFIQTEPMEEERKRMGWQEEESLPYVKCFYEEPDLCRKWIEDGKVVMFGGTDDESYISHRLEAGKPVIRCSERIYKSGQWKAVSPRGLLKKYKDHTRYRKAPVYMLCAGGYVPSDFHIVHAYPKKLLRWGYFPETKHYDVDKLLEKKSVGTILWAARFIDWKHPELPLKAAKYLKDKGYFFHMNIVGGGELEPMVKKLLSEYDLSKEVSLLGYRTPTEVRALMEESDIFLQSSDRKEGWGAVINEAMNSGCAVVANHMIGAVPFLIKHRKNGLIYRDGSEKELFAALEELLSDRKQCHKIGKAAYETIVNEWNSEVAAVRLVAFCMKIGFLSEKDLKKELWEMGKDPVTGPCSQAPVISERKMYEVLTKE